MKRKKAGDLLNILSDPGRGRGLVGPGGPVAFARRGVPPATEFPGMVGLGTLNPGQEVRVAPRDRTTGLMDDESAPEGRAGRPRVDLVLGGLLAVMVTNVVSFTLGARAGRHSADAATPAVGTVTPVSAPATAPETAVQAPAAPATAPAPLEPLPLAGLAAHETPMPVPPASAAAPAPAPAVDADAMIGKYVVRVIALDSSDKSKARAEEIARFLESKGLSPVTVRTTGGKLVVEVGACAKFADAKALQQKAVRLSLGGDDFSSAYVLARTK